MADALILCRIGSAQGVYLVDHGRPGYRDRGIWRGGPADPAAAAAATRLLGQEPGSCCLELTLVGGTWHLSGRGQIALTGADMGWRLNGEEVIRYRLLDLEGENELRGGIARQQCRAYLGVRGQWAVPRVLDSAEAGLPGTATIAEGFTLCVTNPQASGPHEELPPQVPDSAEPTLLVVQPAPEWRLLEAREREWLAEQVYTVDSRSDRQGIRLLPATPAEIRLPGILSSPVLPGTVQLSPAGPILLGPDAQTVGGYPRVLQLAELGAAFQLRPGAQLRFLVGQTVRS
ncbi:hypothetical protein [Neolewinella sp.]|uniref:hypothetical protein n=1 Tax=Neolewinella sp. TaxID=2993543 RepID=UPI003B52BDFB